VISKFKHEVIESQLIGSYNFTNICAAITFGNYFNIEASSIKEAIENYMPSNNRSQIIHKGTNKIILDAYNASPSSMKVALESFEKQQDTFKIAILGDMFELGADAPKEHQYIADLASTMPFNHLILIGENFHKTKIISPKVSVFKSFEDFKTNFDFSQLDKATLFIKGSRGMALERVLEIL
jgi:UDP-N-acetylmuramoyl-tripeptide--D-alanyl-D-alanine ligase